MKALLDTNIILDWVLRRQPFAKAAQSLMLAHANGKFQGFIAPITLINTFYVARKQVGVEKASQIVGDMLEFLNICEINQQILRDAHKLGIADYEDATQAATSIAHGIEIIITRDKTFALTLPKTLSPAEFLELLK